jgi:hypothetical protein
VFYGVYTGTGFLDSLVFNNDIEAYSAITLFAIFVSMLVRIAGVVLLTIKKPEPATATPALGPDGSIALSKMERGDGVAEGNGEVVWQVGDASDDEDETPVNTSMHATDKAGAPKGLASADRGEEGRGLMDEHDQEQA